MSRVQTLSVGEDEAEQRLDRWFRRRFPHISQIRIEKMCRKGEIRVDGGRVKPATRVAPGQSIRVPPLPDEEQVGNRLPKQISATDAAMIRDCIIYRDAHVLALNKPPGLPVQGGSKLTRHIDALAPALQFEAEEPPRLVHRLDKDTSGVLVMARTQAAASKLTASFRHRDTRKIYWALVAGVPTPRIGTIKYALVKAPGHGKGGEGEKMLCLHPDEMRDHPGAKRAQSDYATLCFLGQRAAWMALVPVTGRTHQLRAHMAGIGHPIVGDGKYGGGGQVNEGDGWGAGLGAEISRKLHLHARTLTIEHPATGQLLHLTAPLPDHMKRSWDYLGWGERDVPVDPFDASERWQD